MTLLISGQIEEISETPKAPNIENENILLAQTADREFETVIEST